MLRLDALLDTDLTGPVLALTDRQLLLGDGHPGLTLRPAAALVEAAIVIVLVLVEALILTGSCTGTRSSRALVAAIPPLPHRGLVVPGEQLVLISGDVADIRAGDRVQEDTIVIALEPGVADGHQNVAVPTGVVIPDQIAVHLNIQVADLHRGGIDQQVVHLTDLAPVRGDQVPATHVRIP